MLNLAKRFALDRGCSRICSNVDPGAISVQADGAHYFRDAFTHRRFGPTAATASRSSASVQPSALVQYWMAHEKRCHSSRCHRPIPLSLAVGFGRVSFAFTLRFLQ
jgi:hypothetical protein